MHAFIEIAARQQIAIVEQYLLARIHLGALIALILVQKLNLLLYQVQVTFLDFLIFVVTQEQHDG